MSTSSCPSSSSCPWEQRARQSCAVGGRGARYVPCSRGYTWPEDQVYPAHVVSLHPALLWTSFSQCPSSFRLLHGSSLTSALSSLATVQVTHLNLLSFTLDKLLANTSLRRHTTPNVNQRNFSLSFHRTIAPDVCKENTINLLVSFSLQTC